MADYMNPSVGLNPNLMRLQMQAQAQAQRSEQQRGPYTRNTPNEGGMTAANEAIFRQFQRPINKIQGNKAFMASTMGFTMAMDYQKQLIGTMTSVFKKIDSKELTNVVGNMMGKAGALAYLLPTSLSRVLSSKRDSFEKVFSRELGVVGTMYKTLNLMSLIRYPMRTLPAGLAMLAGFPNLAKLFPRPETLLTGAAVGAYKGAKAVGGVGAAAGGGILNYLTGGAFGKGVGAVTGSAVGGQAVGVLKKVFGGIDSKVLAVLGSPVGLSLALAGAQIGLAIWKSIKLSRLLPSRKSPINLERMYSDSMGYDAVLSRISSLAAVGKMKPEEVTAQASLINAQLLMSIERHTSLLRLMAVEADYKREEREKQGRSYNIDVLGQDPAGMFSQGLNKATGYLHKTIAKYDPITQIMNFIFSGGRLRPRGEIARLEKTYGIGQYGKNIKEQSKSFGISLTESRLLSMDSNQIIQMGLSHEDRVEKLLQWDGELLKGIYSENITLRKGFGFAKNVLYQPHENLKKFGHAINPLNLPGIHALSSLASAPFRAIGAVTRGIWRAPGALRRMISPGSPEELSIGGSGAQGALPVRWVGQLPPGRAKGGPVIRNKTYIVGEEGPELLRDGRVIPLRDSKGRFRSPGTLHLSAEQMAARKRNRTLTQELGEVAEKKEKAATSGTQSGILSTLKDMAKSLKNFAIGGVKGAFEGGKNILGDIFSAGKNLIGSGFGLVGGLFKGILGFMVHNPLITIAGGLLLYLVPKLIKSLTENYEIDWDKIKEKLTGVLEKGSELSKTPIGKYASSGFMMGIPFGIMPGIIGALIGGGVGGFFTLMAKIKEDDPDNIWKKLLDGKILDKVEQGSFALGGAVAGVKLGSRFGLMGSIVGGLLGGGLGWYGAMLKEGKKDEVIQTIKDIAASPTFQGMERISMAVAGGLAGLGIGLKFGLIPGVVGGLVGAGLGYYLALMREGKQEEGKEKMMLLLNDIWEATSKTLKANPLIGELAAAGFLLGTPLGLPGMIAGGMLGGGLGVYLAFFRDVSEDKKDSLWAKLSDEKSPLIKQMKGVGGALLGFKIGSSAGLGGGIIGSIFGYYIASMGLISKELDKDDPKVSNIFYGVIKQMFADTFRASADYPVASAYVGASFGLYLGLMTRNPYIAFYGGIAGAVAGMLMSAISRLVIDLEKDTSWQNITKQVFRRIASWSVFGGRDEDFKQLIKDLEGGNTTAPTSSTAPRSLEEFDKVGQNWKSGKYSVSTGSTSKSSSAPVGKRGQGATEETVGRVPAEMMEYFQEASDTYGVSKDTLIAIASAENARFEPSKVNPKGEPGNHATGIFQFLPSTWRAMGGNPEDITDARTNIMMGGKLVAQNIAAYQKKYGSDPNRTQLYEMHHFGTSGGLNFMGKLESSPEAGFSLSKKEMEHNPHLAAKTNRDIDNMMAKKMGVTASAVSGGKIPFSGTEYTSNYKDEYWKQSQAMHAAYLEQWNSFDNAGDSNAYTESYLKEQAKLELAYDVAEKKYGGGVAKDVAKTTTPTPNKGPTSMVELLGHAWKSAGEYISGFGMPTAEQVKAELAKTKETVMDVVSGATAATTQAVGNVTSGSNNTNVNQVSGQSGDSGLDSFCLKIFNSVCSVFKDDYVKYPFSAELFHSNNIS